MDAIVLHFRGAASGDGFEGRRKARALLHGPSGESDGIAAVHLRRDGIDKLRSPAIHHAFNHGIPASGKQVGRTAEFCAERNLSLFGGGEFHHGHIVGIAAKHVAGVGDAANLEGRRRRGGIQVKRTLVVGFDILGCRKKQIQVPQRCFSRFAERLLGISHEPFHFDGFGDFPLPVLFEFLDGQLPGFHLVAGQRHPLLFLLVFRHQGIKPARGRAAAAVNTVFAELQPLPCHPAEHRDAQVPVSERK